MLFLAITATLLSSSAPAVGEPRSSPPAEHRTKGSRALFRGFEENKGQVRTAYGELAADVRFRLTSGNTSIFLLENNVAFQFSRVIGTADENKPSLPGPSVRACSNDTSAQPMRFETHRMDLCLEGANEHPAISARGPSRDYVHYYCSDARYVHAFDTVVYSDIYPGIDWVWHATDQGVAHEFLVHPGADPGRIRIRSRHHDELFLDDDGSLIQGGRLGRFVEQAPISYQTGATILTRFELQGDVLSFSLGAYDTAQTLTIDPERVWATYYGGASDDHGYSCATDAEGNSYLAGSTTSGDAIADGGYQDNLLGYSDAFLVKFDPNGQRLWGTYYGGGASDQGNACAVDLSGNVVLGGMTRSVDHISYNGFQDSLIGLKNGFLVKFDSTGQRLWATYCGGGDDAATAVSVDTQENIYLAGDIYVYGQPTELTSGGFQSYPGDWMDAFLAKFAPNGEHLWGTYYGGWDVEHATSCPVDDHGNVFLAGSTYSLNGIAYQAFQTTNAGMQDAFLAKFDSTGHRLWGTFYGGEQQEEAGACATDPLGNVYLSGTTSSAQGIAIGGFQNLFAGLSDAFLVKFNSNGVRQWGTYYGPDTIQYGNGCAVNELGEVFLAGLTSAHWGIADAGFQNTFGGGLADAFIAKFDGSGARLWGTYYGGSGDESGEACALGNDGSVYLSGWTVSPDAISYLGCQNTPGGSLDAFLVRFDDATIEDVHDDPASMRGLCAWPNPVRDVLHLNMITDGWLVDELGRSVHQFDQCRDIPLRDISPGIYLLRTRDGTSLSIVKE